MDQGFGCYAWVFQHGEVAGVGDQRDLDGCPQLIGQNEGWLVRRTVFWSVLGLPHSYKASQNLHRLFLKFTQVFLIMNGSLFLS